MEHRDQAMVLETEHTTEPMEMHGELTITGTWNLEDVYARTVETDD
jgi:hypothetical protein